MTQFFFEKLNALGFPTHFIEADPHNATMTVKPGHQIALIDEISGGNMRAYCLDQYVEPLDLAEIMLG